MDYSFLTSIFGVFYEFFVGLGTFVSFPFNALFSTTATLTNPFTHNEFVVGIANGGVGTFFGDVIQFVMNAFTTIIELFNIDGSQPFYAVFLQILPFLFLGYLIISLALNVFRK